MKIVYKAADIVEAHIVSGMLEADGIQTYVGGHYLQGAVGDLSPLGFANVFVSDDDVIAALPIIQEYEQHSIDLSDADVFNADNSLLEA